MEHTHRPYYLPRFFHDANKDAVALPGASWQTAERTAGHVCMCEIVVVTGFPLRVPAGAYTLFTHVVPTERENENEALATTNTVRMRLWLQPTLNVRVRMRLWLQPTPCVGQRYWYGWCWVSVPVQQAQKGTHHTSGTLKVDSTYCYLCGSLVQCLAK